MEMVGSNLNGLIYTLKLLRLQHERVSCMTTQDLNMTLFCQVYDQMAEVPKLPGARLCPSEMVTLAMSVCG